MEFVQYFNYFISILFMVCYAYQFIYILAAVFRKEPPHSKTVFNRYRVLICARNEQAVIANLIASIRNQDYPAHLITVFVVADNCTDDTAHIATSAGAVVYTRHNRALVGKGYAMEYLLEKIEADYGPSAFDGYFVFDADNILAENYITEMNRTFCDGYEIITSYRNSKNYGDNWISAGYGLWFLRESRFLNHPRHLLGTSCAVSGTGFMFSDAVYRQRGGWPFHLLTEDIEFSVWSITSGGRIGYCSKAVFYDEQPTGFVQSWHQRLRWAKGNYQVFGKYKPLLFKRLVKQGDFACFDMIMSIAPAVLISLAGLAVNGVASTVTVLSGGDTLTLGVSVLEMLYRVYTMFFAMGLLTCITQWKQIHTTTIRKILYLFTFPLFMLTYVPVSVVALFADVKWRPITHTSTKNLYQIREKQ